MFPLYLNKSPVISTMIKSEEPFWHFQDELLSNVCQLPNEGIHALSTLICTLVSQCKFPHPQTIEGVKIMVLQHTDQYHEARDWIWLPDESQLTYQSFLPTVSCSSCVVSSIRRPRRRDKLTSQPLLQQPHQHLVFILMPYPPISAAINVASVIILQSVQTAEDTVILPRRGDKAPENPDHPGSHP